MIDEELKEKYPSLRFDSILTDVKNKQRLQEIFVANRPSIVFHAAAYKHVPLLEDNIEYK